MRNDPETSLASTPTKTAIRRWGPFVVLPTLIALAALALPAGAVPGPDPQGAPAHFSIVVNGEFAGETEVLQEIGFDRANSWDFGDRESYRCAYIEYIVGGEVQFKIEFERLAVPGQPANYIVINDRHGSESGEDGNPPAQSDTCGMPAGGGPRVSDGSPFVAGGANFTIYKDGSPLTSYSLPAVAPEDDEVFWSVGDDPDEAYMWYIEPGETNEAVLRFDIVPVAPGVSLSPFPSPTPSPSPSPSPSPGAMHGSNVTLSLEGRLRAFGRVRVLDGTAACWAGRLVLVERRVSGQWTGAGRDFTTANGNYSVRVADREGTYRARVPQLTLAAGDVCGSAVSQTRVHARRGRR
jgi:hypothetical protein